jgi:hypothetical protein
LQKNAIATGRILRVKKYIGSLAGLPAALIAETAHHYMLEIDAKAVFLSDCPLHRGEEVFFTVYGLAALTANQVVVMAFFGVVIDELVAQCAFIDAARFFQDFQGAVYGRLVYPRHPLLDVADDGLGGEVLLSVDDIQNQFALRGQL